MDISIHLSHPCHGLVVSPLPLKSCLHPCNVSCWVHCNCYKNDNYLCDKLLNLSVVDASYSFDRVYVQTVTVHRSTIARMFLIGMMCTSFFTGYLKDLLGPCGWRSVNFTSITLSTHASRHFLLTRHVTKPTIAPGCSSSAAWDTLSSPYVSDAE